MESQKVLEQNPDGFLGGIFRRNSWRNLMGVSAGISVRGISKGILAGIPEEIYSSEVIDRWNFWMNLHMEFSEEFPEAISEGKGSPSKNPGEIPRNTF